LKKKAFQCLSKDKKDVTMVDLLSGGRLMQTIFFYDLGLIKQWEGVDIDEKMSKKGDVNLR
jgi:hypothetical protein